MLPVNAYTKVVRRPYPPLLTGLIYEGYRDPVFFRQLLKTRFSYNDVVLINHDWYYPTAVQKSLAKTTGKSWSDPVFFNIAEKEIKQRERNLLKAAKGSSFKKYRKSFLEYMPTLALVYNAEGEVERTVRKVLRNAYGNNDVNRLMNNLNIPFKDNYLRQEEFELAKTRSIARHVKKFEWILSRYGEHKPYTIAQARSKLRRIGRASIISRYYENKTKVRRAILDTKQKLPARDRHLIDLLQFIVFYRTHRTDVINRSFYEFYPTLLDIAQNKKISYTDLLYLLPDEITINTINRATIKKRRRSFGVLLENKKINVVSDKDLVELRKQFETSHSEHASITGASASPGKVSGIVKIVRDTADLKKVARGNILVASMTTPEFMPAMERAAAFITDEGGITCHAAIISREMEKPCVIGTKIATQVLKDGDRVEVDAKNGVVKKLVS